MSHTPLTRSTFKPEITGDFATEVALGHVANYASVNKFGSATDCDVGEDTDIWDGADAAGTGTKVWIAPEGGEFGRIHAIVSTSAEDGGGGFTGAFVIKVFGLTNFNLVGDEPLTTEVSEDVLLNGTTPVNTVNSYVIIHRMVILAAGSSLSNVGIITATAETDDTITAIIGATQGQTRMAIYGIPGNQRFVVTKLGTNTVSPGAPATMQGCLLAATGALLKEDFVTKKIWTFSQADRYDSEQTARIVIQGPAILKLQVISDTINASCNGTIEGFVVEKVREK